MSICWRSVSSRWPDFSVLIWLLPEKHRRPCFYVYLYGLQRRRQRLAGQQLLLLLLLAGDGGEFRLSSLSGLCDVDARRLSVRYLYITSCLLLPDTFCARVWISCAWKGFIFSIVACLVQYATLNILWLFVHMCQYLLICIFMNDNSVMLLQQQLRLTAGVSVPAAWHGVILCWLHKVWVLLFSHECISLILWSCPLQFMRYKTAGTILN